MSKSGSEDKPANIPVFAGVCIHELPEAVAKAAKESGITPETCLFAIQSDLTLAGIPGEVWLLVQPTGLVAFDANAQDGTPSAGPFDLKQVQKIRSFQTVGSAFLQLMIDGFYVDVVRYSNARREAFGRARTQIDRMIESKPLQEDDLTRPSDYICEKCGLPRPGRKSECPRCTRQHGVFARTLGLMKPYWKATILLLVLMVAGVALDLLPPQLTRLLVDKVLMPRENVGWLPFILIGLVSISAGRSVLNVFIGRTSAMVGTQITKDMRERLEKKLVSLSVDYYNRHSVGSLMSRVLYDVEYFHGFVQQVSQGFLLNVMLVLGIGATLFFMNVKLALWVLVPIPFVVLSTVIFWRVIYPRYYRVWDSQSKLAQMMSSLLSGIRLVKSFGQEEREHQRFNQGTTYMQTSRRRLEFGSATFNPLVGFVFGLGGLIVWYAGGHMVLASKPEELGAGRPAAAQMQSAPDALRTAIPTAALQAQTPIPTSPVGITPEAAEAERDPEENKGRRVKESRGHKKKEEAAGGFTLGTLMAFLGYLGMFYGPIHALSMFSNWVTGFLSAGQRIYEILDASPGVVDPIQPISVPKMKGLVEFKNVTFGYDPYSPILKNVSFRIEPGQFIGIVGKSGSGKTTIVNLICRFYDPQEGQILIDGVDVREINADDLHRQVGLVLQEPFLFRGSIAENIAYGRPDASALAIMDAAKSANAHDFISRRATAYDTKLGEHGAGLSGGERQRVSIARALLCDPTILILDEATSSVDTESEQEIQRALVKLCKGRTTIAIAHRLSTLKNSDHILVIDEGRVVESGSHEQLMAIPNGIYHELVMIQTRLTKLEL